MLDELDAEDLEELAADDTSPSRRPPRSRRDEQIPRPPQHVEARASAEREPAAGVPAADEADPLDVFMQSLPAETYEVGQVARFGGVIREEDILRPPPAPCPYADDDAMEEQKWLEEWHAKRKEEKRAKLEQSEATKENNKNYHAEFMKQVLEWITEGGQLEEGEEPPPAPSPDATPRAEKRKSIPAFSITDPLPRVEKNFYRQVQEITQMAEEDVKKLRADRHITVRGKYAPRPVLKFLQCGLPERVLRVLTRRGMDEPTPIQMQALPTLMSGRDVIGIAPTGSGKTLAFILPLIRHVHMKPRVESGMLSLVLAPTRELVQQIHKEASTVGEPIQLRIACLFGGDRLNEQVDQMKSGVEIVVATPGRLIDVTTVSGGRVASLLHVSYIAVDEVDRMLDQGFLPQLTQILEGTRADRQISVWSATFPPNMVELGRRFLNKPVEITVESTSKTTHLVEVLQDGDKFKRLLHALGRGKSIVYASTQKRTEELHQQLVSKGIRASVIHGGHEQQRRTAAINDLRSGRSTVLVATSVASRGLDIADLRLVVNHDPPDHKEDYVHRAGRVGRTKNAAGIVMTFVSRDDPAAAHVVMEGMQQLHASVPPELAALCKKRKAKARGYGGRGYSFGEDERAERRRNQTRASLGAEEAEDDDMESTLEPSGSPGDSPPPEGYAAVRQNRPRQRASPYAAQLPGELRRSLDGKPSIRR